MTRSSSRPIAALGLVAALLAYVGCNSQSPTPKPSQEGGTSPAPATTAKRSEDSKPFADWSPEPAGVLLISGEQDGYLEPCGCTQGQLGGLLRRYDLAERIRNERKWPLALIDLGSLIKDPAAARGGFEQTKIKFGIALQALGLMKYDAVALSAEDLKLGVFEALAEFVSRDDSPKVVSANVSAEGFDKLVPSVTVAAGPVKFGITAVLDPESLKKVADPAKENLLKLAPIEKVLPDVLARLETATDVQVLMVQGPPERAKELAAAHPGFDVVVATSHFDPAAEPESLNDGKTMLISVGKKGKYVGVVGVFPDAKPRLRYQRVTLNGRYNGPAKPMKQLIEDSYRETLKGQNVVANFVRHDFIDGTPGATFIGAEACKNCHPNTYAKWASTKHAHAFESLLNDPKPNTQFDAECVSCHTTGFGYTSGWKSAEATPYLKGNQCENCHGPASRHAGDPDDPAFRKAIALTAESVQKRYFCIRCHDEDNSPKFDFATHYGQIAHKGMDKYDDPKVHRKQPAKGAK